MITEKNDTYNFYKLTAEDGMVITDWKDGDDIMEYNSAKLIYCPLSIDITKYRELTDAQDEELKKQQEEKRKELEEELEKDHN